VKQGTGPLLQVREFSVAFTTPEGQLPAVERISFDVWPHEALGILGESGCGKSVTALGLLGLLPVPAAMMTAATISLDGRDISKLDEKQLRGVRGRELAMIFQEPGTALNPVLRIADQLADVIRRQQPMPRRQARREAIALLGRVGIPDPEARADDYPHRLSGGMCQRVLIAMALACRPRLLIADEPTTALDVTTQAQVLGQILALRQELGMAVLLISHDLGVIAGSCERVLVMYAGQIVEHGPVAALFSRPDHPYTRGLIDSVPRIRRQRLAELPVIPGRVPEAGDWASGCRFADRCWQAQARCRQEAPVLSARTDGAGEVACHFPLGRGGVR